MEVYMKNSRRKVTLRRFLPAFAGVVTGSAIIFALGEGAVSTLSGALVIILSAAGYFVNDGEDTQDRNITADCAKHSHEADNQSKKKHR
jgi:hypothetical protein